MAFDTTQGSNRGSNNNQRNNEESWKAHGFINLYINNKGGKRSKLGVIVLRESNDREKGLSDWLNADDADGTNLKLLANAIQFEYSPADVGDANHFDLPFDQGKKAA